jgi:hypothetical protein
MAGNLSEVIKKLEQQRTAIENALSALRELDSPGFEAAAAAPARRGRPPKRKGGMTAEGRRRLSEALRARWAAKRAGTAAKPSAPAKSAPAAKSAPSAAPKTAPAPKAANRKGGITAAGRKKLSEALKARWAAKRAGSATKKK